MLLARPPRWKGALPSHNTVLAIECDGPIPSEQITRALDRFLDRCPWPAARLRRPPAAMPHCMEGVGAMAEKSKRKRRHWQSSALARKTQVGQANG
jgi:hypothetical protein